jgi:hypothetical protein
LKINVCEVEKISAAGESVKRLTKAKDGSDQAGFHAKNDIFECRARQTLCK